jgi:hypothetical protein
VERAEAALASFASSSNALVDFDEREFVATEITRLIPLSKRDVRWVERHRRALRRAAVAEMLPFHMP